MTPERFCAWLSAWLTHHPLRRVPPEDAAYTRDVMARIVQPATAQVGWTWPDLRWAMACGAVCTGVIIGLLLSRTHHDEQLAQEAVREGVVLADAGDFSDAAPTDLEADLQETDRLVMLAEADAPASDEALFNELTFLDEIKDEPNAPRDTAAPDDTDVFNEMQWLDNAEVSTPS